ncbi:hypothetical protein D3C85_1848320 [compost metagenome]
MLKTDTYPRQAHADVVMPENEGGARYQVNGTMTGNDSTKAQQITCQPPKVLDNFAPSA